MKPAKMLKQLRKLEQLLEDPHPGLFTWNKAVAEDMKHLNELYESGGKDGE